MNTTPETVISKARELLQQRGWAQASTSGRTVVPFGPKTGPLTLTQALWSAGIWDGEHVDIEAIGEATDRLCWRLGLDEALGQTELAGWAREEGRTLGQVLDLLGTTN